MFILYINDLPDCAMSASFGYLDNFKIVCNDPLVLNIDAKRIWNWCVKSSMAVNVSKTKILSVKGNAKVEVNGTVFEELAEMKDLGLKITSTLKWTENATNRCAKVLKALSSVKRNTSKITTKAIKLKPYQSFVAPFVSYGSSLRKPSKRDLKITESVQKKATAWILNPTEEYKDRLIFLHILPLSLYHELHIPLLLHKILTGKTDLQWKKFIRVKEKGQTGYASMKKYETKHFRRKNLNLTTS